MNHLTGVTIIKLMQANHKTIGGLAAAMNITQARVRQVRAEGVRGDHVVADWMEALTGDRQAYLGGRCTGLPMTEAAKCGGPGRGQGRKPKSASGELMKSRAMRWTDAGWADVLMIGLDRVRALVEQDAAKMRTRNTCASLHLRRT